MGIYDGKKLPSLVSSLGQCHLREKIVEMTLSRGLLMIRYIHSLRPYTVEFRETRDDQSSLNV